MTTTLLASFLNTLRYGQSDRKLLVSHNPCKGATAVMKIPDTITQGETRVWKDRPFLDSLCNSLATHLTRRAEVKKALRRAVPVKNAGKQRGKQEQQTI